MGVAGVATGDVVLLSSQTATADTTLSFTSKIDNTYGEYIFKFYRINPATDGADFSFQANAVGQSGYNEIMQTTYWTSFHNESGSASGSNYDAGFDQALGTGFQPLAYDVGSDADQCVAGEMHLWNPASTAFVKNFYCVTNNYYNTNYSFQSFVAGYFNITAAITQIQFKFDTGAFDGTIKMWGVI